MMSATHSDLLQTVPLFTGLTPEQCAFIAGKLHHKSFAAGQVVMSADQPGEVLYMLMRGTVKIAVDRPDGKQVILAILGTGEIFGEMSLVEHVDRAADVITLERSDFLWMDRRAFQECLQTIPVLSVNIARILSRRLRLANTHIQSLATDDVYGRVARLLLAFASEYGQELPNGDIHIPLYLTQADFAGLVGASRVHISRVMSQYRQCGYVSIGRSSYITIHNLAAIKARSV